MYKLMLVDDEREILNGLLDVIPFEKLGFQVIGTAENGLEGVHLCESLNPDLIITDIRMPLMDGLAMCREIRKKSPTVHFLILTGYDDFEFARQAMSFKSMDYLLKPISSTELIAVLTDTRKKLDDEFAEQRDINRLRANFNESLPLLREMLLTTLLTAGADVAAVRREAPRYQITLDATQYAVAVMRHPTARQELPPDLNDPELMKQAVINIAREVLADYFPAQVFHFDGLVAILFFLPDTTEDAFLRVQEALDVVRKTVTRFLDVEPAVGLGAPCFRLEDLHICARQAISALDHSVLQGSGDILCVMDIEPGSRTEQVANETELRTLANAIKMGNSDEVERTLDELMGALNKPTPHNYRVYLLEVMLALLRTARDMNADLDILGENNATLNALMREPDVGKATEIFKELSGKLQNVIQTGRASASANLAHQAEAYLNAHFTDPDMSVELLCRELHVSASYFSAIYKQEKKETFHQTLTRLRMDLSMTLLATTNKKTTEIAQNVGLADPSYFSHAFKRYFGVSPSQVRTGKGVNPL